MAFTIGSLRGGSLLSLARLMATFYLTCLLHLSGARLDARFHGFSI